MNKNTLTLSFPETRLLRLFAIFAMMIFALTLTTACGGPKGKQYDAGSNGKQITLKNGETFNVGLLVNIRIDSHWQITELDRSIVEPMGPPRTMAQIVVGGLPRLYSSNFMFRAVKSGKTTLKMDLVAPNQEKPLDSMTMTIVVE